MKSTRTRWNALIDFYYLWLEHIRFQPKSAVLSLSESIMLFESVLSTNNNCSNSIYFNTSFSRVFRSHLQCVFCSVVGRRSWTAGVQIDSPLAKVHVLHHHRTVQHPTIFLSFPCACSNLIAANDRYELISYINWSVGWNWLEDVLSAFQTDKCTRSRIHQKYI